MKTLSACFLVLCLVACFTKDETNAQTGKFAESGASTRTFQNVQITAVRGTSLGARGEIVGPLQHLLFLAHRFPKGTSLDNAHEASEAGPTKSAWTFSFAFVGGLFVKSEIEWDRVKDEVTIAGRRFSRGVGNAFLIDIDAKGAITAHQSATVRTKLLPDGEEGRLISEEFPKIGLTPQDFDDVPAEPAQKGK